MADNVGSVKKGVKFIPGNVSTRKLYDPRNQPLKGRNNTLANFKEGAAQRYPGSFSRMPTDPLFLKHSGLFTNKPRISRKDPNYPYSQTIISNKVRKLIRNQVERHILEEKKLNPGISEDEEESFRTQLIKNYTDKYTLELNPARKFLHRYLSFPNYQEPITVQNERGVPVKFPGWKIPEEKQAEHEELKELLRKARPQIHFNTNAQDSQLMQEEARRALSNKSSFFYTPNNARAHAYAGEGSKWNNNVTGDNFERPVQLVNWSRHGVPADVLDQEELEAAASSFNEDEIRGLFGNNGNEESLLPRHMPVALTGQGGKRSGSKRSSRTRRGKRGSSRTRRGKRVQTLKNKLRRGGRGTRRRRS